MFRNWMRSRLGLGSMNPTDQPVGQGFGQPVHQPNWNPPVNPGEGQPFHPAGGFITGPVGRLQGTGSPVDFQPRYQGSDFAPQNPTPGTEEQSRWSKLPYYNPYAV